MMGSLPWYAGVYAEVYPNVYLREDRVESVEVHSRWGNQRSRSREGVGM